jgi:peptidyl-prolyl cis-trans isomerase A (cyclophilin A)
MLGSRMKWLVLALAMLVGHGVQAQEAKQAPETYTVKFETSKGDIIIDVTRKWAPLGADRFYELVTSGFYDECRFFRVVPGFVAQFGVNGDPKVQAKWRDARIKDDKPLQSNVRKTVTFATSGPNSRTTQLFINYGDNAFLDTMGFAPFGVVVKGMDVADKIESKYRERPQQPSIQRSGNEYLKAEFPDMDFIKKATIVEPPKK